MLFMILVNLIAYQWALRGLGKKLGLSDTMTKFISSSVNNAVDYNKESINRDKPSKGE